MTHTSFFLSDGLPLLVASLIMSFELLGRCFLGGYPIIQVRLSHRIAHKMGSGTFSTVWLAKD
jgi:hypothetical protein